MKTLITVLILSLFLSSCINPQKSKNKTEFINKMSQQIIDKYPSVNVITPTEALKNKNQYLFVDIREKKEYDVSMLPGAISIHEFERDSEKYKDKHIVTYCTIGLRSTEYALKLKEKGFKASNLKGSILGWVNAQGKIYKDGKVTQKVHVYAEAWNFLPETHEGVWK